MSGSFDRHDPGRSAQAWDEAGLGSLPDVQLPAGRIVVLAAHPDDETLGCGGLLSAASRRGAQITVIVATDGEQSHPNSPTHTPADLGPRRRIEAREAVARLAPNAELHLLGLPDGGLEHRAEELDAALAAALDDRAGEQDDVAGGPPLLLTPWRHDRHPDHEACAASGVRMAGARPVVHWEFPIWAWHWADPHGADLPWPRLRRFRLSVEDRSARAAALREYVSQLEPLSDRPGDEEVVSAGFVEHFAREHEVYVLPAAAAESEYFDRMYQVTGDPWGLVDRFYEQRKRAVLLASLPRARFTRAFEPGCALGLLTEQLRGRCEHVVAWDTAETALEQARARVGPPTVTLERGRIPSEWPPGRFDLIVLSEVGYYCDDLSRLRDRVLDSLTDDGVLLACHWRRPAPDHPRTAEQVHAAFDAVLTPLVHHVEPDFVLDVWDRVGLSVAEREGITDGDDASTADGGHPG